jgi:tetratricopeptide (TPR) repeat protein
MQEMNTIIQFDMDVSRARSPQESGAAMGKLVLRLLTVPVELLLIDSTLNLFNAPDENGYHSVTVCLALHVALEARLSDIIACHMIKGDESNGTVLMKERQHVFLGHAARLLEGQGGLEAAEIMYRRVCRIGVDPASKAHPQSQANDANNHAVCLRKVGRLEEALAVYERALTLVVGDEEGVKHITENRAQCLLNMREWNGTKNEYTDVLAEYD